MATIERATVPWLELERLLRREGQPVPLPARAGAPAASSMTAEVSGEIHDGRARLHLHAEISVLADRWIVAPLLSEQLAVSAANIVAPDGRRGLLVRTPEGVAFAADGLGLFQLDLDAEGPLEDGARLVWSPPGLAGGRARIELRGPQQLAAAAGWRVERGPGGLLVAQAALGAGGLRLALVDAPSRSEAVTTLEELRALTVVSLGGTGVTRLTMRALASEGEVALVLPQGSRLWKAYVNGAPARAAVLAQGLNVKLPARGTAEIELAYTFDTQPMGIRGRWRVELPRLPVTLRDARWEVWLPEGLKYRDTQASLAPAGCCLDSSRARTPLETQGKCNGFSRAVLEPGRAYVEGLYEQAL
jgi:hypothetical protein